MSFGLTADTVEFSASACDGCGESILVGHKMIGNIDSCCGGCTRALCFECVKKAYALVLEQEAQAMIE